MPLAGENLIFPPYESADDPTPVNPRPALTLQQATDLTQKLYGRTVTKISTLPSHVDQNFLMVDKEDTKYILKIINSEDSKNDTLLELQTLALSFVHQNGIPAQKASPNIAGQLMSMEEIGNAKNPCSPLSLKFTWLKS